MDERKVLYTCRHCERPVKSRQTRGLCWGCRMSPKIRVRYTPIGRYGRAGAKQGTQTAPTKLPEEPTYTQPGSEERIAVYAQRLRRGELLFHPDDRNGADQTEGYGFLTPAQPR